MILIIGVEVDQREMSVPNTLVFTPLYTTPDLEQSSLFRQLLSNNSSVLLLVLSSMKKYKFVFMIFA